MDLTRDFAKLTERLKDEKEVRIPIVTLDSDAEVFSYGLLSKGLSYINQVRLDGTLQLVVSELLRNAEKALLKRTFSEFFVREHAIDSGEFARSFAIKYREDIKGLRVILARSKPRFEFVTTLAENSIIVSVRNQGLPTPREDEVIHDSIRIASDVKSVADLTGTHLRSREGDGYGLALSSIALKNADLDPIQYSIAENETIFSVRLQASIITPDDMARIDARLFAEVSSLPSFPDHIRRMMELCNSPDSDLKTIALEIGRDQGIASQIIRLANSGGFAGGRVADISEAVKIIGLANVSGLLLQVGAYSILEARYGASEELQTHTVRVGVYSRLLARKFKMAAVADQAYVAGLLHDIGKLVIVAHMKNTGTQHSLEKIGKRRDRRSQINMEEIQCGADHALIGEILAKKWNFPPELCQAIGCHHKPLAAQSESRRLIFTVYLANCLADYEEEKTSFYHVEPEVLAHFNLTTQAAFEMLAGSLNSQFLAV